MNSTHTTSVDDMVILAPYNFRKQLTKLINRQLFRKLYKIEISQLREDYSLKPHQYSDIIPNRETIPWTTEIKCITTPALC